MSHKWKKFEMQLILRLAVILFIRNLFVTAEINYVYDGPFGDLNNCYFAANARNTGSDLCTTTQISGSNVYQGTTLTWKIVTEVCPQLIYAGCADPEWTEGEQHNITRDLVWDRSCNTCPRCPCNNDTTPETYYINNYTTFDTTSGFQVSQCYGCRCEEFYTYWDGTQNVEVYARDCRTNRITENGDGYVQGFNDPDELQNITCPVIYPTDIATTSTSTTTAPQTCDNGNGNKFYPGQYFFYNDGNNCDTYCYCTASIELECVEGWDNVMNNGDAMKYAFLSICSNRLQDAWNDTTRWYKSDDACVTNFFTGASNCPYPLCRSDDSAGSPEYQSHEFDSVVYDDDGNIEYEIYDCVTCSCIDDGGFPTDQNVTDCTTLGNNPSNIRETDACDYEIYPYLNCTSNKNGNFGLYSSYYSYCGWSKQQAPSNYIPGTVCVQEQYETNSKWGANVWDLNYFVFDESDSQWSYLSSRVFCDAFYGYAAIANSEAGLCSATDISFTVNDYDCIEGSSKNGTQNVTIFTMCCNNSPDGTRACNQQEPGRLALGVDNECVSNSRIKDFYETVYECEASDRGVSEDYIKEEYCDIALSSTTDYADRVCDLIENRWRYDTYCDCIAYRKLEKMYGNSDYENIIRDVLQDKFDEDHGTLKYHLEKWNDYYSCWHTFECDITANITDYTTTEQTGSPTTSSPAVSNTPSPSKEDNTSDTKVEISTGSTFFVMMILVILRVV